MQVDMVVIQELAKDGVITSRPHPALPLLIHNYTPRCQYERLWTPLALQCRGLITDTEGNVISRPFPKFFNLSEHEEGGPLPRIDWSIPFAATEKVDGALGILYPTLDGMRIATRGSFESPQAVAANAIFAERRYDRANYAAGWTYLFEIVCPESRVVIDYGGKRDLVLLDIIQNSDGAGQSYTAVAEAASTIGCPVVRSLELKTAAEVAAYAASAAKNEEGVVLRFNNGQRVKVKLSEYCRLHRILTGLNPRHVWEILSSDGNLATVLESAPDEFNKWIRRIESGLQGRFMDIANRARLAFEAAMREAGASASRKDYALRFLRDKDIAPILFAMLDGKDYRKIIWKMVYPSASEAFRVDNDG